MTGEVAAKAGGGTARGLIRAHLETCRPYTLAYPGLVGLAGAGGGGRLLPAVLGPMLAWLGAHYLGDYLDRHLDAVAKPQRPIPSGRLSPRSAMLSALLCFAGFWGVALLTDVLLAVPAGGITVGTVLYSAVLKARGLSGNLVRGGLTASAYWFGALTSGEWRLPLAFAALFWAQDAGSNLVGTLRDIDGDRTCGYRTLPVRHGARATLGVCALLFGAAACAAVAAGATAGARLGPYAVMTALACCLSVHALDILVLAPRPLPQRTALKAHEVLVLDRLLLAGAAVYLAFSPATTAAVLLPAVALSALTQRVMRTRHEIPPARRATTASS